MHVGLRCRGHVVVDHVGQEVHIESAGCHVSGHQELRCTAAQSAHHAITLGLIHPAMQRLGSEPSCVEHLGELVDLRARAAEDQRRSGHLHIEDAPERRRLMGTRDHVGGLRDAGPLAIGHARTGDLDALRIAQVLLSDAQDALGHRG